MTLESLVSSWRATAKEGHYGDDGARVAYADCANELEPFARADREMRQWIKTQARHGSFCPCSISRDAELNPSICSCGLSALRKSLEESK